MFNEAALLLIFLLLGLSQILPDAYCRHASRPIVRLSATFSTIGPNLFRVTGMQIKLRRAFRLFISKAWLSSHLTYMTLFFPDRQFFFVPAIHSTIFYVGLSLQNVYYTDLARAT